MITVATVTEFNALNTVTQHQSPATASKYLITAAAIEL